MTAAYAGTATFHGPPMLWRTVGAWYQGVTRRPRLCSLWLADEVALTG